LVRLTLFSVSSWLMPLFSARCSLSGVSWTELVKPQTRWSRNLNVPHRSHQTETSFSRQFPARPSITASEAYGKCRSHVLTCTHGRKVFAQPVKRNQSLTNSGGLSLFADCSNFLQKQVPLQSCRFLRFLLRLRNR